MRTLLKSLSVFLLINLVVGCVSTLQSDVEAVLYNPEQTGIRWGLVVADMEGTELLAMRADDRFTPASNTKIITTMASYHHLEALSTPELNPGTRVFMEPGRNGGPPDLILVGGGDAMLNDAPDCETSCLEKLANIVAGLGHPEYDQVIGDDSFFPHERWGVGWGLEDVQFYYGTAISALSLNDNLVWVTVMPNKREGGPASAMWRTGDGVFKLSPHVTTSAEGTERKLRIERFPGAEKVRIYGQIPVDAEPVQLRLAINDPAERVAKRFAQMLELRGIKVTGSQGRHRPITLKDEPPSGDDEEAFEFVPDPAPYPAEAPFYIEASPLTESLARISKDSENLHADIALRRLGLLEGSGSRSYGVAALEAFLDEAGVPEHGYALHGGSGMSVYNRISPRSMVKLLAFAAKQDWFEAWLADQPIGGVDGSLERRFKGTALEGKIFAKTGTLNGANALSGVMVAESGERLLFSIIANDRPSSTRSATPEMDAALLEIAAAY